MPFNIGMRGLVGCTSVVVISRAGVYVSHLWENPSFIPANFQREVLDALDRGGGTDRMPGIRNLTEPRPQLPPGVGTRPGLLAAANRPEVLIITPVWTRIEGDPSTTNPDPNPQNLHFPAEVAQIEARLRELPGYEANADVPVPIRAYLFPT